MKPTIKELWFDYQQEKNSILTEEQREVARRLSIASEELARALDTEAQEKFEKYQETLNEIYSLDEYEAFERGVSFAVRFLSEAMG